MHREEFAGTEIDSSIASMDRAWVGAYTSRRWELVRQTPMADQATASLSAWARGRSAPGRDRSPGCR